LLLFGHDRLIQPRIEIPMRQVRLAIVGPEETPSTLPARPESSIERSPATAARRPRVAGWYPGKLGEMMIVHGPAGGEMMARRGPAEDEMMVRRGPAGIEAATTIISSALTHIATRGFPPLRLDS
jgi:hypothetical protein